MRFLAPIAIAVVLALIAAVAWPYVHRKQAAPAATSGADATQAVHDMRSFADRGCACKDDKECFRAIRDEFDGVKRDLLAAGAALTGDAKAAYDADLSRLRLCGDGAGLTVWVQ